MRELTFTIVGVAQPQGSTRAFLPKGWTRPIVTSDNKKNKPWRQMIANVAALELGRADHGGRMFVGPIALEVDFYLPRPKKWLVPKHANRNIPHTSRPDIDKLVRSAADALTGVVWSDDSQLTDLIARKRYCAAAGFPRAVITVRETMAAGSLLEAS